MNRIDNFISTYCKKEMISLLLLGFASGLPFALTTSTLGVWMRECGIDIATIGYFAIVAAPYSIKFIFSPLTDLIEIPYLTKKFGLKRSWMLTVQFLMIVLIVIMGNLEPTENLAWFVVLSTIIVILSSIQDNVVDGFRIQIVSNQEYGNNAAFFIFGYRIGMLYTGAFALFLSEYVSWSLVYCLSALGLIIGIFTVLYNKEPEVSEEILNENHKMSFRSSFLNNFLTPLKDLASRSGFVFIALFTVFFKFGDALASTMMNPFLLDLGFAKVEIAKYVKLYGLSATLIGTVIGAKVAYRFGLIKCLWIAGIIQMLSNIAFMVQAEFIGYNVPFLLFTIFIENTTSGIGLTIFVAYLSSLCNHRFATAQYAVLAGLSSVARNILSAPSGKLVELFGWTDFFLLTVIAAVPGLILLSIVSKIHKTEASEKIF